LDKDFWNYLGLVIIFWSTTVWITILLEDKYVHFCPKLFRNFYFWPKWSAKCKYSNF